MCGELAHSGGRVFTQVGRKGWGSFIDELCGHQHDSHLGAKPSRLSTSEEPIIIHNPYPLLYPSRKSRLLF